MNIPVIKYIKNEPGFLWLILACGMIVRVWGIWEYAFNPDEMQFLIIAKGATLSEVWQRGLAETHPPLAHFIHHYLLMISSDFFVQRLFSVTAGLVSILGMYCLGRLIEGKWLGMFLAVCMAFSPLAVATSMTFRNYAFFMMLLVFALCAFFHYQQTKKTSSMVLFALLLFLACSTHFTGFMIAATCGITMAVLLLRQKDYKHFSYLCLAYIPILLLACVFYLSFFTPGTAGTLWEAFTHATGAVPEQPGEIISLALKLGFAYFFPLIGVVNWAWITGHSALLTLVVASGGVLMVIYAFGLYVTYRKNKFLSLLIFLQWPVAIIAAVTGHMFLAPTRHNLYFLPIFLIPYGYLLEPWLKKWICYPVIYSIVIIVFTILSTISECYVFSSEEFTLTNQNLTDAQHYLDTHLQSGDLIVSRSGYFYILYEKDSGQTPYDEYAPVRYNHQTRLISFDSPLKPYNHNALRNLLNEEVQDANTKIWFVQYGWKTEQIWHLMECPAMHSVIADFFSRDGALIFSVKSADLYRFLRDERGWYACFSDYTPHITGEMFRSIPYNK